METIQQLWTAYQQASLERLLEWIALFACCAAWSFLVWCRR